MLRPMVDPARPPGPQPDRQPEQPSDPLPAAPADPPPVELAQEPAPVYVLPTARKVVSSGLQLALTSTGELRRASIYIGLLVLGAFGPAILALMLIVGRLGDQAGEAFGSLLFGDAYVLPTQPALEAALLVVAIEALIGVALFLTISIDAQVMGIAILGGRASERPLRLWESITRARQTFWRMAGAGTLVGVVSAVIQVFILGALGGLSQSAETANVVGSLIATILVAPLAYVATSIVLGDVGAMEALSRSWRLFRVRRGLAVVVVLFTFVTSAIQLFALSAGLDLVIRASELLHVSLTEGALAFTTAVVLILAAIVAYGSLTFTIGAIVAAPQVAGFLGLTFYSGGLDRARVDAVKPPRGFRYVSRPMAVAMLALGGIVALQIPAINAIPQLPASGLVEELRQQATIESDQIDVRGYPSLVEDPLGDVTGSGPADIDLVRAEGAYLVVVPAWVTDRFDCDDPAVACGGADVAGVFDDGAYVFLARAGSPLIASETRRGTILVSLPDEVAAFRRGGEEPYGGASRIFVTQPGAPPTLEASRSAGDHFTTVPTSARSRWSDTDIVVLIPARELGGGLLAWDVVTLIADDAGTVESRDTLRADWNAELRPWDFASILIEDFREPE
jgi:hypothetical protein